MHAAAPELDHALAQTAQTCQIKFGVAVSTANAHGLCWRQKPVGSYNLSGDLIAYQQMLAVVVKQIDVVARHRGVQSRAHLVGKDAKPQTLSLSNFVSVLGP
jgi:hypothetical protein